VNVAGDLCSRLRRRGVLSAGDVSEVRVSVAAPYEPREHGRLPRRFTITRASKPLLNVKLLPPDWPFRPRDIAETQKLYGSLGSFKVPELIDHFPTPDGHFFVEEYIASTESLAGLVKNGDVSAAQAVDVVREILVAVWESGEAPSASFIVAEKRKSREHFRLFVEQGWFADVLFDHVESVLDASKASFRKVLSSGDIIDRNILRVNGAWYLVDFEYSHPTLFLFRDGYRNILYSAFAAGVSLRDLSPFLGIPEDIAAMLSLAWEIDLYNKVLEPRTRSHGVDQLRRGFWTMFDSGLADQLDNRLAQLREALRAREGDVSRLRENLAARDAELDTLRSDRDEARREVEASAQLREALRVREGDVSRLRENLAARDAELDALRNDRDAVRTEVAEFQARLDEREQHVETLRDEAENVRRQLDAAHAEAAARRQASEASQLEVAALQKELEFRGAELTKLESEREGLQSDLSAVRGELDEMRKEAARARTLETELTQMRAAREDGLVKTRNFEAEVRRLDAETARARDEVRALEDVIGAAADRELERIQQAQEISRLQEALLARDRALSAVFQSRSWRVTRPLRVVLRMIGDVLAGKSAGSARGRVDGQLAASRHLAFFVDEFRAEPIVGSGAKITARGWCFAVAETQPVLLQLRSGTYVLREFRCDGVRDDVAAVFLEHRVTSSLPRCGFHEQAEARVGTGSFELFSPRFGVLLATISTDQLPRDPVGQTPDQLPPGPTGEPIRSDPPGDSLKYGVDVFRITRAPFGSRLLEVAGWCFAQDRSDPITVKLRGDGVTLEEIRCSIERPDVAAMFAGDGQGNSSLPFCGFVEVADLADGPYDRFELVTANSHVILAEGSAEELEAAGDAVQDAEFDVLAAVDCVDPELPPSPLMVQSLNNVHVTGHPEPPAPLACHPGPDGRPVKVACFSHNLKLEGATKVLLDIALGLSASGRFLPTVISPSDGPARELLQATGVNCRMMELNGTENVLVGWRSLEDYEKSVESVCEIVAAERPDVVIAMVLNNFVAIEASARLLVPSLWLIQESYNRPLMMRQVNPFAVPRLERAFEVAHRVVFGSRGTSELYQRYNRRQNFEVIHNALRPEEIAAIDSGPDKAEARRLLGIPPDKKVILSVGTVCERKDQTTLARGLGLLAQRRHDFVAYIVGARWSPYARAVGRMIAKYGTTDCVQLVPETPDVHTYYRAADLFAFASLNECFPLVILEAMAHGLPIVTTKCIGVSEQVRFGENAVSFEFRDAMELARQCDELLSESDQLAKMGAASLNILMGMQNYADMIAQYETLVLSAVQANAVDRAQ
jgi:glycosyltransferase involved in cell wall biosynthesis